MKRDITEKQQSRLLKLIETAQTHMLYSKDAIYADSPDSAHNQIQRAVEKLEKAGKELHGLYYLKQRGVE